MPNFFRLTAVAAAALLSLAPLAALAQERVQERETKTVEKEKPGEPTPPAPKEESSVTEHSIKIGGQSIAYKATAGTILLKNEKDEPQALIYSTSYVRTDTKDPLRPISFIYNGGPGSASVWLHMGAFGPRRVVTPNAESTPPPPYKVADNALGTLLDRTDMVFIDPVGTGFSHAVGKA